MATQKQSRRRRLNMTERAEEQMKIQFPDYPGDLLWKRSRNHGFSTIPRTLPLAMQAIDAQTKGQPAGHVLLCLWIRAPDHPLLTIDSPNVFATEAGFEGERAVDTWRRRMRSLRDLGFIETKEGSTGDFHYVLLLNLFRDQLGDRAAVQRTLFHELFHYGLRKFLTKAQFTEQMMRLYSR